MDRLQVKMEIDRLNQEINELKSQNAELHSDSLEDHQEYKRYTYQIIKDLRAENARYREALQVYADDDVIGTVARKALKEIE